jgi:F0F1-type ATP synthase delta subunit
VSRRSDGVSIEVELQSTADLDAAEAQRMEEALAANLGEAVDLALIITRVQRMEASWAGD